MPILTRRFVLSGLLAAPAIVRAGSLMPARSIRNPMPPVRSGPFVLEATTTPVSPFPGELWWDPLSDTMRAWDGRAWQQIENWQRRNSVTKNN